MTYTEKTDAYIEALYTETGPERELRAYAERSGVPVMRRQTAQLVKTLVSATQPGSILEIGTAVGYSGLVMLSACGGHLTTVELDEESWRKAAESFALAGMSSRVTQILGDAHEVAESLTGQYDTIFLDGAKAQYVRLLEPLLARLAPGGMLIADNVLFWGMVSGERPRLKRKRTIVSRMRAFLAAVQSDERLVSCVLPVGDGLSLSVKRKQE